MNKNSTYKNFSLTGIIMTIIVTIGLVWAGWQWQHRYDWPRPITEKDRQANDIKAFKNLQLICAAQDKYIQRDWDNDGRKVYSRYLAHLWTTLSKESDPILIKLMSLLHNDFRIQPLDSMAVRGRRLNSLFPKHLFLTFYM